MKIPGPPARGTPHRNTPQAGVLRVAHDANAARGVAVALAQLVQALMQLGKLKQQVAANSDTYIAGLSAVRGALRALAAQSREGPMLCRVINGTLVLDGASLLPNDTEDSAMATLITRLDALHAGAVTIREGAAPGELLTLGRMLAGDTVATAPSVAVSDTPIVQAAITSGLDGQPELLRTWSVLVTAPEVPSDPADAFPLGGKVMARLGAARSDEDATVAVNAMMELVDELRRRGDSETLDAVVRGCVAQIARVGEGGGRLALERAMRMLQDAPLLTLLAQQLPHSPDKNATLAIFARAGDAGASTLVEQLLLTTDAKSRRVYFDCIVALDLGSAPLLAALNDHRWYVVRNAATLLGEMGVEHADKALVSNLTHDDERIRVAVARALTRLCTAPALQALHDRIDDANSEVRRLSAAAYGLARVAGGVRPPAARLAAAVETETDEDAALEMVAALGRLSSADAIQRLLRLVMPATADITGAGAGEHRPAWIRIAALDALLRARGNQMRTVVVTLTTDEDPEVAQAARVRN